MQITKMFVVIVLGMSIGSTVAFAADKVHGFAKADTRDKFEQVVVLLKKEMGKEGRYRFVSPSDRVVVENKLAHMGSIFGKTDTVDAMSLDQKTELYNAQEKINSIPTQNDTDRIVCKNRKIIGSNIPRRTCMTYGELKEEELAEQEYMRRHLKVHCQFKTAGRAGAGLGQDPNNTCIRR